MKFERHEQEKFFKDPRNGKSIEFASLSEPGSIDLSVIVPSYNEEVRLPRMLDECVDYLQRRSEKSPAFSWEIIIVDDGSSDSTTAVGMKYSKKFSPDRIRVLTLVHNRGKGGAVRLGTLCARGRQILFADADGATKFADITSLESALDKLSVDDRNFAIAVGNNFVFN